MQSKQRKQNHKTTQKSNINTYIDFAPVAAEAHWRQDSTSRQGAGLLSVWFELLLWWWRVDPWKDLVSALCSGHPGMLTFAIEGALHESLCHQTRPYASCAAVTATRG